MYKVPNGVSGIPINNFFALTTDFKTRGHSMTYKEVDRTFTNISI